MKPHAGVRFYVDENLPPRLTDFLSWLKVPIESVEKGMLDDDIFPLVGRHGPRGGWITQDLAAKKDHRDAILESGISVAWLHSGSDPPLTAAFLTLSFVYRFTAQIEATDEPLYFNVRVVSSPSGPNAEVSPTAL